ncbi:hypothetical protein T265_14614, partial [Opisthorchis viverrini]
CRGSKPTSAVPLPPSGIGQPGSIQGCIVHPLRGIAARHRRGVTAETFSLYFLFYLLSLTASCGETAQWLEREFADRKVRGSNPTPASRIPPSVFGQPGSIKVSCLITGGIAARHRKCVTAERFFRPS